MSHSAIEEARRLHADEQWSQIEGNPDETPVEFWCFSPVSHPAGQLPVVW